MRGSVEVAPRPWHHPPHPPQLAPPLHCGSLRSTQASWGLQLPCLPHASFSPSRARVSCAAHSGGGVKGQRGLTRCIGRTFSLRGPPKEEIRRPPPSPPLRPQGTVMLARLPHRAPQRSTQRATRRSLRPRAVHLMRLQRRRRWPRQRRQRGRRPLGTARATRAQRQRQSSSLHAAVLKQRGGQHHRRAVQGQQQLLRQWLLRQHMSFRPHLGPSSPHSANATPCS